jgi:hypothetical protein
MAIVGERHVGTFVRWSVGWTNAFFFFFFLPSLFRLWPKGKGVSRRRGKIELEG